MLTRPAEPLLLLEGKDRVLGAWAELPVGIAGKQVAEPDQLLLQPSDFTGTRSPRQRPQANSNNKNRS